jgi:hypothetical protein
MLAVLPSLLIALQLPTHLTSVELGRARLDNGLFESSENLLNAIEKL